MKSSASFSVLPSLIVLACPLVAAQTVPLPKSVPVQVTNSASQPVQVAVTNQQPVGQSPAMYKADGNSSTLGDNLIPEQSPGAIFVVQSIDLSVSASQGQLLTSAHCNLNRITHSASAFIGDEVAQFGLAPNINDATVWTAHQSVYWVFKEHESLGVICRSGPGNWVFNATAGGYSTKAP